MSRIASTVLSRVLFAAAIVVFAGQSFAQPPDEGGLPQRGQRGSRQAAPSADRIVARMMAFDKNKDGKLTRDEITDPRLLRLFDRADANHDGIVTKEELTALAKKMIAETNSGGRGGGFGGFGGPDGPQDGPGGDGGDGPGGFGPPGGFGQGGFGQGGPRRGGPPQPGQVLPQGLQDALQLTAAQKKQVAVLQKEVDEKLASILTDAQQKQLKSMQSRRGPNMPPPEDNDGPPGGNRQR
jgi:hypothetical protein